MVNVTLEDFHTPLEIKVALLYYGLQIPPKILKLLGKERDGWNWGRSTGAGPAGGRYFELLAPRVQTEVLINIPLQSQQARFSPLCVDSVMESTFSITTTNRRPFCMLKLLPVPTFGLKSIGKRLAKEYALLHAKHCLASTVNQRCVYWQEGLACKFCGIELSLDAGNTVEIKRPENLVQALELALAECSVTHVTLTIGTQADDSRGIRQYIPIIRALKEHHPEITVHAQFEPPSSDEFIPQLREVGCDTVGIHVEITDDAKRLEFCPGKGHLSWEEYLRTWEIAVDAFGRNQVDSYLLLGLEPFSQKMLDRITEMCRIGVVPYPVPVREIPGTAFETPPIKLNSLVSIHRKIADIMHAENINPLMVLAGCVRCSACSAIGEAFNESRTY